MSDGLRRVLPNLITVARLAMAAGLSADNAALLQRAMDNLNLFDGNWIFIDS